MPSIQKLDQAVIDAQHALADARQAAIDAQREQLAELERLERTDPDALAEHVAARQIRFEQKDPIERKDRNMPSIQKLDQAVADAVQARDDARAKETARIEAERLAERMATPLGKARQAVTDAQTDEEEAEAKHALAELIAQGHLRREF
jgi:hypothetical protein